MKKLLALIAAAAIAASMTGCGDGEARQANAAVTEAQSASHDFAYYGESGTYTGGWSDGKPNGEGSYISADGTLSAAGNWSNGQLNGQCRIIGMEDNYKYTMSGDFFFDVMQGNGDWKLEDSNGNLIYTYSGEFKDFEWDGTGEAIFYFSGEEAQHTGMTRQVITGSFSNSLANGTITLTNYLTAEAAEQLGADVDMLVSEGEAKDGALIEPYRYTFYKGSAVVEQGRVRDGKFVSDSEKMIKDGVYDVLRGFAGDGWVGDAFDAIAPNFYDRNAE